MTIHANQFDARDDARTLPGIGARGVTIAQAVTAAASNITSATLTTEMETGFLRFRDPFGSSLATVSGAKLGTARAQPAVAGVVNAANGNAVAAAEVIAATGVTSNLEGDFSVGTFELVAFEDTDGSTGITIDDSAICPHRVGTARAPGKGNVVPSSGLRKARVGGLAPGIYQLCLTTSEKRDQRLIIVNHSSRAIVLTDIAFQTEDGTQADLTDAVKAAAVWEVGTIGSGESVAYRVSDMAETTGDTRRTAATMSFQGPATKISVATAQANLLDGSTDTVEWPAIEE